MAMTLAYDTFGPILKVTATWTSNGSGAASASTAYISGEIIKGVTNPGATAPTDDYDITITDGNSLDVLGNCEDDLADRDTANTEEVYFLVPNLASTDPGGVVHPVVADVLTIAVANAGDTKDGVLDLYIKGVLRG